MPTIVKTRILQVRGITKTDPRAAAGKEELKTAANADFAPK